MRVVMELVDYWNRKPTAHESLWAYMEAMAKGAGKQPGDVDWQPFEERYGFEAEPVLAPLNEKELAVYPAHIRKFMRDLHAGKVQGLDHIKSKGKETIH